MKRIRSIVLVVATIAAATSFFWAVLHQISSVWLDVALRPEVQQALERSMEDQKTLRRLDPERRAEYRRRFDETQKLVNRIEVIRLNREAMLRRFELAMLLLFAVAAAGTTLLVWIRHRRAEARERREYVERVGALQETARRQAHEIKGPLTAARLELERLADLLRNGANGAELTRAHDSVAEELDRLARYTREFSSFAGVGKPVLQREDLVAVVDEFCTTFANAWPGMELRSTGTKDVGVSADRDMLRQVLVNLCTNSAHAGAKSVVFSIARNGSRALLDIRDDGAGIPASLRARVFDPYVTTRRIGEGMGLGLSISRKVMLDHGGDLEVVESRESGTVMRVTLTCA